MSEQTLIQWADSTVNPTMGCEGCELWLTRVKPENFAELSQEKKDRRSCYAGLQHDKRGGKFPGYAPTFAEVKCFPGRMLRAAKYRDLFGLRRQDKPWLDGLPRLIFVSDLSDSLSKSVSFEYLAMEIIANVTSALGQHHYWLWLTKQPARMADFSQWLADNGAAWPSNLWAGTSITEYGNSTVRERTRIEKLLDVGAEDTIRFISLEPQFGPAEIPRRLLEKLDWLIQGGASASPRKYAHPFDLDWAYDMKRRCAAAGTPLFLKQLGSNVEVDGKRLRDSHGGDWDEWPEDLRTRQMPIYVGTKKLRRIRQRKLG